MRRRQHTAQQVADLIATSGSSSSGDSSQSEDSDTDESQESLGLPTTSIGLSIPLVPIEDESSIRWGRRRMLQLRGILQYDHQDRISIDRNFIF